MPRTARTHRPLLRPDGERERGRAGDVEHVVRPEQRRLQPHHATGMAEIEARPVPRRLDFGDPVVRVVGYPKVLTPSSSPASRLP